MTFQKIFNDLSLDIISPKEAYDIMSSKEKMKTINFYAHLNDIKKDPLSDGQLQELESMVNVLQTLYTSSVGSPVSDSTYDTLQEMLIDMGIPRLTGSVEINDSKKISHTYKNLRGTLDKVYYLSPDERRTNKSRKYLDEWISSTEAAYHKATGQKINLNDVKIICQPKFDGASAILEWDGKSAIWLSRGDTAKNRASDITPIMKIFNDLFCGDEEVGIKFEVMMTEENKNRINELYRHRQYKNSRQVVTATLNSNEPDFKADYLYPVPLRICRPGEDIEQIHPMLLEKFPTITCTFGDREKIRNFADTVRWVNLNGMRLRTDGVVMTIIDPKIQRILGRENDINKFEVAYKTTEEAALTRVKDVEFYFSEFGYITPVLVVNDVILKGNTINHISLSNKERFDELNLSYGDTVKVLYDIIPYVTIDETCRRQPNGRKIEFIKRCPKCHEELDLSQVEVQCKNPNCPSKILGRVMNYCNCLRIKNIGYQTLEALDNNGLLKHGIRSLYKLRKKITDIEDIEGFGKLKARKLVNEIEAKRRLKDYEFFGALGIEGLSTITFQTIFENIRLNDFMTMIDLKNFDLLGAKLVEIKGIGNSKADLLVSFFKDTKNRVEVTKILEEVTVSETYRDKATSSKGRIVFTGCRPDDELADKLTALGFDPSDSWSNSAKYLVIPYEGYASSKVEKATTKGIPIVEVKNILNVIGGK